MSVIICLFSHLVNFMKLVALVDEDEHMQSVAQQQVSVYYWVIYTYIIIENTVKFHLMDTTLGSNLLVIFYRGLD